MSEATPLAAILFRPGAGVLLLGDGPNANGGSFAYWQMQRSRRLASSYRVGRRPGPHLRGRPRHHCIDVR
jgi:hypothetical protein